MIDLRDARVGVTFTDQGKEWTVVRIASGTAKNPTAKKVRGHSHVLVTTDGKLARLYSTCQCGTPGEVVDVMNLVTEETWQMCGTCRAVLQ